MTLLLRLHFVLTCWALSHCASPGPWIGAEASGGTPPSVPQAEGDSTSSDARVRLYCRRVAGWRAATAVHSWIALRPGGRGIWQTLEVMGYGRSRSETNSYIRIRDRDPESRQRGGRSQLLLELQGDEAERAIARILQAVDEYPYADRYVLYPGPNSNTFISYLLRAVPEIKMELPPTAVGKDWLPDGALFAVTESGTGGQFSLFGLLGVQVGAAEGVEFNLLGMSLGLDVLSPALKLPFVGRVGFPDRPVFAE